jgi:hypothetical protein
MKRIAAMDVLGQVRRARNILNRVAAYLEQQERAERRAGVKRMARARAERDRAELVEQA